MNSSTFWSCSCESSAVTGSGARVQYPEPRDVGGAVAALHVLQRLRALGPMPGVDLRLAEEQLRVLGALEPALLYALLDKRQALSGLALVDVVHAELHEVVAVFRGERFLLVLGAVLLRLGEALGDEVAQALVALGVLAVTEQFQLVTLVDDRLRLGGDAGLQRQLPHLQIGVRLLQGFGCKPQGSDAQ